MHICRYKTAIFPLRMDLNSRTTEYLHRRQTSHKKLVCRFLLPAARSLQKTSGFFHFTKKERSKCILPTPLPSIVWKRLCKSRPAAANEAAAETAAHKNIQRKTATADFASTTEKRMAAPKMYVLCWTSVFPAAQLLSVKPSKLHMQR